jgi:monofunctional biosynthetic peptidoglycan transglycosylase
LVICVLAAVVAFYATCVLAMAALRWINPPVTSVQVQQRFQALLNHRPYHKHYQFVPLTRISPALQHAVIAAEDARFYQHHGFDWIDVQKVIDRDLDRGELGRGGSTIDQQLVKNLFLTTSRSLVRKGVESTLVPLMERMLPKNRILELYLNVIEWGPGIYGAEAASEHWYHVPASRITREQALRLAAIIPAPSRRRPAQMNEYAAAIDVRMRQMGW